MSGVVSLIVAGIGVVCIYSMYNGTMETGPGPR